MKKLRYYHPVYYTIRQYLQPHPIQGTAEFFYAVLEGGGGASATVCDGHVGVRSTFMAALHLEEASTRESANIYADNVFVSRDRDL